MTTNGLQIHSALRRIESVRTRGDFLIREMTAVREGADVPEDWRIDQLLQMRLVLPVPGDTDFPGEGQIVLYFGDDLMVSTAEVRLDPHHEHLGTLWLADPMRADWQEEGRKLVLKYNAEQSVETVLNWITGVLGRCWSEERFVCEVPLAERESALV